MSSDIIPVYRKTGHTGTNGFDTGLFIINPTPYHLSGVVSFRVAGGSGGINYPVEFLEPFGIKALMVSDVLKHDRRFRENGHVTDITVTEGLEVVVVWYNKELNKWFNGDTVVSAPAKFNHDDEDSWSKIAPDSTWYWEKHGNEGGQWGQHANIEAWRLFCKWFVYNELINHKDEPGSPRIFMGDMGGPHKWANPSGHPPGSHSSGNDFDILYFTTHPESNYTQTTGRLFAPTYKKKLYELVNIYDGEVDERKINSNFHVPRNIRFLTSLVDLFPQVYIFMRDFSYHQMLQLGVTKYGFNFKEVNDKLWPRISNDSEPDWNHHIHYHIRTRGRQYGKIFFREDEVRRRLKELGFPEDKY